MCDIRCKFCGKECKNQLSRARHERSCKLNPNIIKDVGKYNIKKVNEEFKNFIIFVKNLEKA